MIKILLLVFISLGLCMGSFLSAEEPWQADPKVVAELTKSKSGFNYEEQNVPAYSLPDPLKRIDGTAVTTPAQWPACRNELMELFRTNVFGHRPEVAYEVHFTIVEERDGLLGMNASGRLVDAKITAGAKSFAFPILVFMPGQGAAATSADSSPKPAVIHINNREFPSFDAACSVEDEFWPVREILKRGYVAAAVSTHTIDPDRANGFGEGVRGFFARASGNPDEQAQPGDAWKALSAWGWGASRALDYVSSLSEVDKDKVAVIGHSRGGKTALWAAAEDTRFWVACSNNSGCGGAAISRRRFGETVARITDKFPFWFCDRFATYAGNEASLPIDQHQLFALIAPRGVYATSAAEDLWADPRGEYLSLVASAPVFQLFGDKVVDDPTMPALSSPRISGPMGYHIRPGEHGLTLYDWSKFLDFCDHQKGEFVTLPLIDNQ